MLFSKQRNRSLPNLMGHAFEVRIEASVPAPESDIQLPRPNVGVPLYGVIPCGMLMITTIENGRYRFSRNNTVYDYKAAVYQAGQLLSFCRSQSFNFVTVPRSGRSR